ncbi:4-vinyl reductase [Desulfococcaceae bacterium HSG8]|nr:4-vinyl reductase [Desulfococcaceae bacterium HSG8]
MFKEDRDELRFSWSDLGNIREGRPNLGDSTSVTIYRLMQYTLRDVLIRKFGPDMAGDIYYEAGEKAGEEFCRNMLNTELGFEEFIAELQKTLREHCVGIFRVEEAEPNSTDMTITMGEDLDCSGLPMTDEMVCDYDEGFIAGILKAYTGQAFKVRETDCWAMGGRICRFKAVRK